MEVVAHHLQLEAFRQHNASDKDVFGRTAFNRYYYASFLHVRAGLSKLKAEWSALPHKDIPEVLKGTIKKELKQGGQKAAKIRDGEAVNLCSKATSAALELSKLMLEGYATRVTADYTPEVPVQFLNETDFALNTINIKHASEWPRRADAYIGTIVNAWNQIHA